MNLSQAQEIADEFAALLRPVCERVEVAGSVRRADKSFVKDIEIVVIPTREYYALLESMLADGTIAKAIYDFRKGTTRRNPALTTTGASSGLSPIRASTPASFSVIG